MPRTSLKQHQQLARLKTLADLHSVEVHEHRRGSRYATLGKNRGSHLWRTAEVCLDDSAEQWIAAMEEITRG